MSTKPATASERPNRSQLLAASAMSPAPSKWPKPDWRCEAVSGFKWLLYIRSY